MSNCEKNWESNLKKTKINKELSVFNYKEVLSEFVIIPSELETAFTSQKKKNKYSKIKAPFFHNFRDPRKNN